MSEEEGIVGLSVKERARLVELSRVKAGEQTLTAAALRLGISGRQAKRIWKRYRRQGARGLSHLGRGRSSNRALEAEVKRRCLQECQGRLKGFGPTLAAEKLREKGLEISHETLRRWLMAEGLWKRSHRRGPHRKWRAPMEHFGELVQMDGSFHDWFERGDKPCLIDLVDDATGRMGGEFFEQETTEGAMRVLWRWIETYGIPRALYTDRKSVYVTPRQPTLEEQLAGKPALTAFGEACHKLGIEIIPAASPQAKGRIERRHGVLQDRLVKELRLEGIKDLARGNELLRDRYLEAINTRFSREAVSNVDLHRPLPKDVNLADVFVFEQPRTVQSDATLCWDGRWYQIDGPRAHVPPRGAKVLARRRLDGSRVLLSHGKTLDFHELPQRPSRAAKPTLATPSIPPPSARWTPPLDHSWRRPFTAAQAQRDRQIAQRG